MHRAAAALGGLAALLLGSADPAPATAQDRTGVVILGARYAEPTRRYDHGVLGDDVEWGALVLTLNLCPACETPRRGEATLRLPDRRVFEDTAPRLADLDGDGAPEVIAVESDLARGARLAVYGPAGPIAATPFIGQRHRWLAPLGAADLDGDGAVEIAYVDRPHLAKVLRIWRFEDGTLRPVAEAPGHSNHRIGWTRIPGGIRNCPGAPPEIITASGDWARVQATRFDGEAVETRSLGPYSEAAMTEAMACGG